MTEDEGCAAREGMSSQIEVNALNPNLVAL
jgi:hypothetical protein